MHLSIPQNEVTLSRNMEECEPLPCFRLPLAFCTTRPKHNFPPPASFFLIELELEFARLTCAGFGLRAPLCRGVHSSTSWLIVSTFVGNAGWSHGVLVTKTAQVELRSGLV
jgi:hypothetical protein